MVVAKIYSIKTTLKKAIDYICNGDKTSDEIYVTTHLCSRENAHKEFEELSRDEILKKRIEYLKENNVL